MPGATEQGVFITGFPGFIARRLVARLIGSGELVPRIFLLVEARFVFEARNQCRRLEKDHPGFAGRWTVVVGDLRRPSLGVDPERLADVARAVTHVWHLAAIYDLAVPQSLAYAVNVAGTERVLDFCQSAPSLERLLYISTCFVAGQREGRIYEAELDCGQDFKNHYESTKFWAEQKVQQRWDHLPTTIFRPSIVAGDSTTGETAKADGPYFMIQLMMALPSWVPMVHFGRSDATFNVVPVDFVVEAMVRLSCSEAAAGRVFQLADPAPRTARDFMEMTIAALGRAPAVGRVPADFATRVLALRGVQHLLPIPAESMAYLNHQATFDVSNTAELLASELDCPRAGEYWPTLVQYATAHPEIFRTAS